MTARDKQVQDCVYFTTSEIWGSCNWLVVGLNIYFIHDRTWQRIGDLRKRFVHLTHQMCKADSQQHSSHGLHIVPTALLVLSSGHFGSLGGLLDELSNDEAVADEEYRKRGSWANYEILPRSHVRHVGYDIWVVLDDGAASNFHCFIATTRWRIQLSARADMG